MKILVYCGLHSGESFRKIFEKFDMAIGFEPIPALCQRLKDELRDHENARIFQAAVAQDDGVIAFNLHSDGGASSIGQLSDEWRETHNSEIRAVAEVSVPCINLGSFLTRAGIREVDTLVTDVQGYDLAVLRTLESFVRERRIRCITCEVELDDVPQSYEGAPCNKEREFRSLFDEDYELVLRMGEEGWWTNDLTWLRRDESDRAVHLYGIAAG